MKTKAYYTRTSTLNQDGERFDLPKQIETYGKENVFFDQISGKIDFAKRPQAKRLLARCQAGEIESIYIPELSRLGRTTRNILNTLEELKELNIDIIIEDVGVTSTKPNGQRNGIWTLLVNILSAVSELELSMIRERTREGLEAYKQRGGKMGRPFKTKETPEAFMAKTQSQAIAKRLKKNIPMLDIREVTGAGLNTIVKVKKTLIQQGR